jgi:NitT/TauT family transport system substrate-binding protein
MDCSYVKKHPQTVQKLANAFVKTLGYINDHTGAELAAKMPADYASGSGGAASYAAAIDSSKGMFGRTGVMDPAGARNVLTVLSKFNPDVKAKVDSIDLSKTYVTSFAKKATT